MNGLAFTQTRTAGTNLISCYRYSKKGQTLHACLSTKRGGKGAIFMEKDGERRSAMDEAVEAEAAMPATALREAR